MSHCMSNGTAVRQCRLHLFSGPRAQTRVSIIAECANSSARAAQTESRRSIHATNPNAAGGRPRVTRLRREMYRWLDGRGRVFREHTPGTPNYLGKLDRRGPKGDDNSDTSDTLANDAGEGNADEGQGRGPKAKVSLTPFPANKVFRSQAVLSEELRDRIFEDVVVQGMDIATASAQYSVDVRRVAAVVRLKTIENNWVNEGKTLALPYASAVMSMLPQTRLDAHKARHESINDLPVHAATTRQIFLPTSESRQFTRQDASKAFHPRLLSADERIPLPELIAAGKDLIAGLSTEQRHARIRERDDAKQALAQAQAQKKAAWEEKNLKTVPAARWDFKFENTSVDKVGKDGRSRSGIGHRYGLPHQDRKRGQIKIPQAVA